MQIALPVAIAYVPGAQAKQVLLPLTFEKYPTGQLLHSPLLTESLNVPAGQATH